MRTADGALELKNRNVLVMGLGSFGGGLDSALYAYHKGANVTVTDLSDEDKLGNAVERLRELEGITLHLGRHDEVDFRQADVVVVNPAVGPGNRYVETARQNGAVLTSQVELFFQECRAVVVGITGSNGKSTTTALTAHLLRQSLSKRRCAYTDVHLSGNIGDKPLLGLLDEIGQRDIVILELSSFQLEQLGRIGRSPFVSLLTNITPNHLDRHKTMEEYIAAKENIFAFQVCYAGKDFGFTRETAEMLEELGIGGPVAIFNGEDRTAAEMYDKYAGRNGVSAFKYSVSDLPGRYMEIFNLPGRANLSNLAGAVKIASVFGGSNKMIKAGVSSFKGLSHRLECVSKAGGVRWYNDSISTTPESTIVALEAFSQPRILIAGGYDKGVDFGLLAEKIVENAKRLILIGQTAEKIEQAVNKVSGGEYRVFKAQNMSEAVRIGGELAEKGDVVLLSPACASYGMFQNFRERGRIFTECVKNR